MEHIWITINDLGVFLVMILVGAVVWLASRSLLFKIFESSRLVESISIILALSVGVVVINQYLLSSAYEYMVRSCAQYSTRIAEPNPQ